MFQFYEIVIYFEKKCSFFRNTAEKVSETEANDVTKNTENHGADFVEMKNLNIHDHVDCSSNSKTESPTFVETVSKEAKESLSDEKHQSSINQFIVNPKCNCR